MVRKIQGKIKGLKTDQFKKKPVIMECKKEDCEKEAEDGKDFCEEHKEEKPAETQ